MKITTILFMIMTILIPAALHAQTPQPIPPLAVLQVTYEIAGTYGPSCSHVILEMMPPPVEIISDTQYMFNPGETVYLKGLRYPANPRCGTSYAEFNSISGTNVVYDPGGSPDGDYYITMGNEEEITVAYYCIESTQCPTTTPPAPTPTPDKQPGDMWFNPPEITVRGNESFDIEIHMNSGEQIVASYTMDVTYNPGLLSVNTGKGNRGVSPGIDGFISAVNISTPGTIAMTGFDPSGKGPGGNLHLLTLHWNAGTVPGSTEVVLHIPGMYDMQNQAIYLSEQDIIATVIISNTVLGDVNLDGSVDIIDALLTAQYFVGLNPSPFYLEPADVDCNGDRDIIDALLMAQFYVGLITGFQCL